MAVFTLVTGIAGIISLLLPFIKDLSKWKLYFYGFSLFVLGITAGIVASMSDKAVNSFTGDQVLQIILFLSFLAVGAFVAFILIKREKEMLGYMFLLIVFAYISINLDKLKPQINIEKQDILLLSKLSR